MWSRPIGGRTAVLIAVTAWVVAIGTTAAGNDSAGTKATKRQADPNYVELAQQRLELARRTLTFVEKDKKQPRLRLELERLADRIAQAAGVPNTFPKSLYDDICRLRRRIILSHPSLQFDRLLINKRPPPKFNHQSDQYLGRHSGIGAGLVVLES